jgi:cell division protein FtsA
MTGIDIGTYQVKVVIASPAHNAQSATPRIIGTGITESKGLRHGYIVNGADVERSVRTALSQAERMAGARVKEAYLSVGGIGLDEIRSKGDAVIARADSEVSHLDIEKATDAAREAVEQKLVNRRILHAIPLSYALDGSPVLGRPEGMKGTKLSADVLFITCLSQHLDDLVDAVENVDVAVSGIMASPLAGSFVTLSKAQKMAGCVLANIGAETVSIVVFEHGIPISLKVFPIGSTDITNDIALGLKISIEEAEQLKLGALLGTSFPKKKLDDIIAARLADIFELIEKHLKSLGKNELLPAGIVLAGGGSGIGMIGDIARSSLKLPSRVAALALPENAKIRDSMWAPAYGLTIWGLEGSDGFLAAPPRRVSRPGAAIASFFKQFLP